MVSRFFQQTTLPLEWDLPFRDMKTKVFFEYIVVEMHLTTSRGECKMQDDLLYRPL